MTSKAPNNKGLFTIIKSFQRGHSNFTEGQTRLNEKIVQSVEKIANKQTTVNEKIVQNLEEAAKTSKLITDALYSFQKTILNIKKALKAILFSIIILYFRVFLWDVVLKILNISFSKFANLPEAYKVAIMAVLLGIPAAIIAQILGALIINRIIKKQ